MSTATRLLPVDPAQLDHAALVEAAALIRAGQLVAFPTETVYGLGANALDSTAIERVFAAKQRPSTDPLIVHLAQASDLPQVAAHIPALVETLAAAFWPGPLTLVLPRGADIPLVATAGRETVAVRVPRHPVAHALIEAAERPLVAPSANLFGHTSPTTAQHVLADLDGQIALVLDSGPTEIGLESTVLDLTSATPTVLRPGGISVFELEAVLDHVVLGEMVVSDDEAQPAPGMQARHYAPRTPFRLYVGDPHAARAQVHTHALKLARAGQRVGLLLSDEDAAGLFAFGPPGGVKVEQLGPQADLPQMARRLYAALRALDAAKLDILLARDVGSEGLALAISDRLRRAASDDVVQVS